MEPHNLLNNLPDATTQEQVTRLIQSPHVHIEWIVSGGQASPPGFWYDQDEEEWVLVLTGSGSIRFQDTQELVHLTRGDSLHIPAHRKHRVEWTDENSETVWVAVFWKS